MMTHTIRLRGPWLLRPLGADEAPASSEADYPHDRVQVPDDWTATLGAMYRGRAEYRRRFHRPTGLEIGEAVFLVFDGVRSRGMVQLNGAPLGCVDEAGGEFDISAQLDEPNILLVRVEHTAEPTADQAARPGGIVGEVRLEIRPRTL
ncbi:MAG: hypothetical protein KDA42_18460 [Planctomycetales bacterium]|nr:hypothetical protein [Planctomycetales bacterium]